MHRHHIPGVSETTRRQHYIWGKPSPMNLIKKLDSTAKLAAKLAEDLNRQDFAEYAWALRAAADAIEALNAEIIRLGGT